MAFTSWIEIIPATHPIAGYPLAVIMRNAQPVARPFNPDSQEHLVRTAREALIFGNGMAAGMMAVNATGRDFDHNVRWHPAVERPMGL